MDYSDPFIAVDALLCLMNPSRQKPVANSSQRCAAAAPNLSGLPDDLLSLIVTQLDLPSLRALAKTTKRLNKMATRRLCGSVDLTSRPSTIWRAQKPQERIVRIAVGFAGGLHRHPDRWAGIHSISIPVSPGMNGVLLSVLLLLRPTLKSLTLRRDGAAQPCNAADTILHRLSKLSTGQTLFPNLTQLSIEHAGDDFLAELSSWLYRLPRQEQISVTEHWASHTTAETERFGERELDPHPSLHSLAISYSPYTDDFTTGPPGWVVDLIHLPVGLEQLDLFRRHHRAIEFGSNYARSFIAATLPENGLQREGLQEFRYRLPGMDIINLFRKPQDLPLLRVFGATDNELQAGRMQIEAVHIPAHASLETLFVGVYLRSKMADADNSIIRDGPHVRRLPDHVVNKLQAAPMLSSIQFAHPSHDWDVQSPSHWDNNGRMGISIATLHHGDEELYVVRSRTRSLATNRLKSVSSGQAMFAVQADTGKTFFVATEDPVWQYATNYSGRLVPHDVLAEMATVEGVDEWVGRDVQVSDKAWNVLARGCNDRALAGEGQ